MVSSIQLSSIRAKSRCLQEPVRLPTDLGHLSLGPANPEPQPGVLQERISMDAQAEQLVVAGAGAAVLPGDEVGAGASPTQLLHRSRASPEPFWLPGALQPGQEPDWTCAAWESSPAVGGAFSKGCFHFLSPMTGPEWGEAWGSMGDTLLIHSPG
uniref:Uncharacterized protein n=1 Tax=Knipowitschia caucasica TaxID=637954 RepID=A0AAV2JXW4_KNICA